MKILTADEIRNVESKCFENYYSEAELMLRAGTACYNSIITNYGKEIKGKSVAVYCGNGKNAGDGFVIAKLLFNYGCNSCIVLCDKEPQIAEPLMYFNDAVSSGVPVVEYNNIADNYDYIVDCIFGIGFHGEPKSPFDRVFSDLSESNAIIISVDTPSGTDATTGKVCKNAVSADCTIAISTLKYCHVLPPSNANCGRLEVVDIGIPECCYDEKYSQTIEKSGIKLPPIDFNSNKGTNGHLLCLCGSYTMPGASVICASAAIRSGVGLVKIMPPKSAYPLIASHLVQPVFDPVDEENGMYSKSAADSIIGSLSWSNSVVIGCGMGVSESTREITCRVLKESKVPVIIDADGINCLTSCIDIFKEIKVPVVLTPHPGEMARLVSKTVAEVQGNRISVAKQFAAEYGVVLVLKGANTIVTDGESVYVNLSGNPSMSMGGTGDMLSGIIGSFAAQGMDAYSAAKAAVFIHGESADKAVECLSMRGITVFDMIDQLGALMSEY